MKWCILGTKLRFLPYIWGALKSATTEIWHPNNDHDYFFQFYKLDIVYQCPDGSLAVAPASHIMSQLHEILKTAPASCEHPVGVLTTEHRDSWTETRQNLLLGESDITPPPPPPHHTYEHTSTTITNLQRDKSGQNW